MTPIPERLQPTPLPEPDAMWNHIHAVLREPPPARRRGRPWLLAAALLLAVMGGATAGVLFRYRAPAAWATSGGGALMAGQWLVTDAATTVGVRVGRIGTVTLAPNSRLRREDGGLLDHRLRLEQGTIHAVITAPPRLFAVATPVTLATDLGCAYELEVEPSGASRLHVTAGWVELASTEARSVVPAGMMARVDGAGRPGTPYPATLADEARAALDRVDRGAPADGDLDRIFDALAAPDDYLTVRRPSAVTLWHLLPRVQGEERVRVFLRLSGLVPPPDGVTREAILALDRHSLERWRRELSPMWSDEGQGWLSSIGRRFWNWAMR